LYASANNAKTEKMMSSLKKCLLTIALFITANVSAEPLQVTLHYVGPTSGSVWMGVEQGVDEANLQGEFLGQVYTIKPVTLAELEKQNTITAVLVAGDADTVMSVAKLPKLADVAVLNLTSDADSLRRACQYNLLSIAPSQQMKQDALAQWNKKHADTPVTPRAWHESFRKFAASQLNSRFKNTHNGINMDDDAWAGWAAVKMISDTVARTQKTDAKAMLNYLHNDIAFDGQKGDTATFRETGQLRQIVLLIDANNKIAAEAPLRGVKGGLDSLGLVSCPK
jgi:hypothetical protein